MNSSTISALYEFQLDYLFKLSKNIPEDRLYEKQLDGLNSAGWILGHVFVEAEDILRFFEIEFEKNEHWNTLFRNTTGEITQLENLPSKKELISAINSRYKTLHTTYLNLNNKERSSPHPSTLIKDKLPNVDSWIAHHLTTHISVHCGNLATWKRVVKIDVGGY